MTKPNPNRRVRCQEYPDIATLDRDQIIWCAGFMDGESCISIAKQKNKDHNYFGYTLSVAISQKTEAPLKRFQEMFGGHLFSYKGYGTTYYRWQQWSHGALNCLLAVYPYLLVKQAVADVCMRFQIQMTEWNEQYGRKGYPENVVIGRETFYLQARELNARTRSNLKAPKYERPEVFGAESQNIGGKPGIKLVS